MSYQRMLPEFVISTCRAAMEHAAGRLPDLQTVGTASHREAVVQVECLGNFLLSTAEAATSFLCTEEDVDSMSGYQQISRCTMMGVGVLIVALSMRSSLPADQRDAAIEKAHFENIDRLCDENSINPDEALRFTQLLEMEAGRDNVTHLRFTT